MKKNVNIMNTTNAPSADSNPKLTKAIKDVSREVFANLNGEKATFLQKLSSDPTARKTSFPAILGLFGTGLFTKEELISTISRTTVAEKDLQICLLNAWLNSDVPPNRDDCVKVMDAFHKEKDYLTAEVLLSKNEFFPMADIAKFFIDNAGTPMTESFALHMASNIDRLKDRKAR